jgi:short-subunit dehydrogenase
MLREDKMEFSEKYGPWAVIAGASEGTGRAFSKLVARKGLNCLLVARRQAPLDALAEEISAESGVPCLTATIDLTRADAADRMMAATDGHEIGLFINNAGSDTNGSRFLDNDLSNWVDLVNRNVLTTMRAAYAFAGPMRVRGRGGIILVGSGACYGGASSLGVYSGTKAFDLCFGEGLWAELQPHGVDVLNLILGKTDTPAFRTLLAQKGAALPTDWASPDDVARVGLERLTFGPVHNWGLEDDVVGYAPNSAATRRARVLMIDKMSAEMFGRK